MVITAFFPETPSTSLDVDLGAMNNQTVSVASGRTQIVIPDLRAVVPDESVTRRVKMMNPSQ